MVFAAWCLSFNISYLSVCIFSAWIVGSHLCSSWVKGQWSPAGRKGWQGCASGRVASWWCRPTWPTGRRELVMSSHQVRPYNLPLVTIRLLLWPTYMDLVTYKTSFTIFKIFRPWFNRLRCHLFTATKCDTSLDGSDKGSELQIYIGCQFTLEGHIDTIEEYHPITTRERLWSALILVQFHRGMWKHNQLYTHQHCL